MQIFSRPGHIRIWGTLCLIAYFWPEILGLSCMASDYLIGYVPNLMDLTAADSIQDRYLWTRNLLFGFSYARQGLPIFFHFPEIIFLHFFSVTATTNLSLALYFALSLFCMWTYLRRFIADDWACTLGAIAFTFSTAITQRFLHGSLLEGMLSLPLLFLLVEKYLEKQKFIYILCLAAVTANSFLVGHPQLAFYNATVVSAYLLYRNFQTFGWCGWKNISAIFTLYQIQTFTLIAIWLLPMAASLSELETKSRLAHLNFPITSFGLWQVLFLLLNPLVVASDTLATPSYSWVPASYELGIYIGLPSMILLVFGLGKIKKIPAAGLLLTFLALTLIIFFLRFESCPPVVLEFFNKIPLVGTLHHHGRFFYVSTFSMAVIAAKGLERLHLRDVEIKKWFFPAARIWVILLLAMSLFTLNSEKVFLDMVSVNLVLGPLLCLISLFIMFKIFSSNRFSHLWCLALIGLLSTDLIYLGLRSKPGSDPNIIIQSPPKFVRAIGKQRYVTWTHEESMSAMNGNRGLYWNLMSTEGFVAPYLPDHFYLFYKLIGARLTLQRDTGHSLETSDDTSIRSLQRAGVSFIITDRELMDPKLALVETDQNLRLYQVKATQPALFSVKRVVTETDPVTGIYRLQNLKEMREEAVVIKKNGVEKLIGQHFTPAEIHSIDFADLNVVAKLKNEGASFLILNEAYRKEWTALLDGQPTPIYLANGIFRGVYVPSAGEHTLSFHYEDPFYSWGKNISLLSCALLLAGICVLTIRARRHTVKK